MYGGFIREVDKLGRIVIPKQLRKELGIDSEGSIIAMFYDGKQIILKKAIPHCIFCGADSELNEFETKFICATCLERLKSE